MKAIDIKITKHDRGWNIRRDFHRSDFPSVTCNSGATTLTTALWKALDIDKDTDVLSLIVNGKPLSRQTAYDRIDKKLRGTNSEWWLPRYKALLID